MNAKIIVGTLLLTVATCGCVSTSSKTDIRKTASKKAAPARAPKRVERRRRPLVEFQTNLGVFQVELFDNAAPRTVGNFLNYVAEKHYDGTVFHRVIANFMIQGGGYTLKLGRKTTKPPIKNEADNGLSNKRGTIAMARTPVVDSATDQFFINLVDNTSLDHTGSSPRKFGYCVFGKVVKGMDVVDKIARAKTFRLNYVFQDLPKRPVIIKRVVRLR